MAQKGTPRQRLDAELVRRKFVATRSQAESYIKLGRVRVNQQYIKKAGWPVGGHDKIDLSGDHYVSRAGLKLASAVSKLHIDFTGKTVLDVGSSTGGFTDYALQHGAKKVIAVDVGTDQLHPKLRADRRVELHEKTDIREFHTKRGVDIVLIDVSFISIRKILPVIPQFLTSSSQVIAMVKPQFEVGNTLKHKGVIKNDRMRRDILKQFEQWARKYWLVTGKADTEIAGAKGNIERFYVLSLIR